MKKTRKELVATILAVIVVFACGCTEGDSGKTGTSSDSGGTSAVTTTVTTLATSETTPSATSKESTPKPVESTTPVETSVKPPTEETTAATTTTTAETTTVTTTTVATTTVATTTAKPAPAWTETKISNATKYVNTSCYSRKKAVLGAETVAVYNVNDKVTVVAKTDTGYFKLKDGTFIHGDYLSDSKVVIQTTTTTTATTTTNYQYPQRPDYTNVEPEAWTEDDVWYVLNTVKEYAESKGYYGCDFPTEVTHFDESLGDLSFGDWGGYDIAGKVWANGLKSRPLYYSHDKQLNIENFIFRMKKTVDSKLNHTFPNWEKYKFTVTTGKDMLKYYEYCGWQDYEDDEIYNCNVDTAYVFIFNH